jgi:hypothetical protein
MLSLHSNMDAKKMKKMNRELSKRKDKWLHFLMELNTKENGIN